MIIELKSENGFACKSLTSSRCLSSASDAFKCKLGLMTEHRTTPSDGMLSDWQIEISVRLVAVAVIAKIVLIPSLVWSTCCRRRYEGRKLCDHSDTQWASSMQAKPNGIFNERNKLTNLSLHSFSGDTNNTRSLFFLRSSTVWRNSVV